MKLNMKTLGIKEIDMIEAIEIIQIIREKVHLGFASHDEIEDLLEFENLLQETNIEFQSEFWL